MSEERKKESQRRWREDKEGGEVIVDIHGYI